jgi:tRNA (adenine22-N1)-methyltransferase
VGLVRELGPRLGTIASLVLPGASVIDVGTDHGLLAIALAASGRALRVIASDVHEEPLANCRRNLAAAGPAAQGRVDVRFGSGLTVLRPGEVNTATVAGMGGAKILDVLFGAAAAAGEPPLPSAEELGIRRAVVQPTSNVEDVRAALARRGWTITHEALTCTGRWAHVVLAAEPPASGAGGGPAPAGMSEEDAVLGPLLRRRPRCEVYRGWLRHQLRHYRAVEDGAARLGRCEPGDVEASRRAFIIDRALRTT